MAITTFVPLAGLTVDSFREAVLKLDAERELLLRLADEEFADEGAETQGREPAPKNEAASEVTCPGCETAFGVGRELDGKRLQCKTCKTVFRVTLPPDNPADS
ncbi:zinc ribbon domain-containing protein [Zavarzinella formosa]|uniref:hypothetical protein n=1 Tax=Zavarzinella formosa TaxID=360055 RepID=UPI0002FEC869|nr:hypothetical protein [Zavarzinella formosa]